jgi:hypothetical protein
MFFPANLRSHADPALFAVDVRATVMQDVGPISISMSQFSLHLRNQL